MFLGHKLSKLNYEDQKKLYHKSTVGNYKRREQEAASLTSEGIAFELQFMRPGRFAP